VCPWHTRGALRVRGYTIKRGAHIFASTGEVSGITHVAAENAEGSRVAVMTNDSPLRAIESREAAPW